MYIKVSCQKILSQTNENDLLSFLIFPLLVMSHEPQMCMFSYLFGGMLFLFSMVFLHWYIWPKSTFPIVIWSYKSIYLIGSHLHIVIIKLINWTSLKFHIKTSVATMPLPSSTNNYKLSLKYDQINIPVDKELENIAMEVFFKVLRGCKIVFF